MSQIAEETGINRNTITALYHGKAVGLQFSTLDKICNRYHIDIGDIIGFEPEHTDEKQPKMYRQILSVSPVFFWPRLLGIQHPNPKFFDESLGSCDIFFRNNNCEIFWHTSATFQEMAQRVYTEYGERGSRYYELRSAFFDAGKHILYFHNEYRDRSPAEWSDDELLGYINKLRRLIEKFWAIAIFIDSFDLGFDNTEVEKIAKVYGFTPSEIAALLTPAELSPSNQCLLELLELVKKHSPRFNGVKKDLKAYIQKLIQQDKDTQKHIQTYADYGYMYDDREENFSKEFLAYARDEKKWKHKYMELKSYGKKQTKIQRDILRQHKISHNPLGFFAELSIWREYRNLVTLKSNQLIDEVVDILSLRLTVEKKYLMYMSLDEVDTILRNLTNKENLEKRYTYGMLVSVLGLDYKVAEGDEALTIHKELEEILVQSDLGRAIAGKVGAPGYAQGIARVIADKKDSITFKEGEILVARMTDDDMMDALKKAAAVVVDEGNMLCHAAVHARMFGKPCLIDTHTATRQIKTGDIVAVRAHHGTVRVLSQNHNT